MRNIDLLYSYRTQETPWTYSNMPFFEGENKQLSRKCECFKSIFKYSGKKNVVLWFNVWNYVLLIYNSSTWFAYTLCSDKCDRNIFTHDQKYHAHESITLSYSEELEIPARMPNKRAKVFPNFCRSELCFYSQTGCMRKLKI